MPSSPECRFTIKLTPTPHSSVTTTFPSTNYVLATPSVTQVTSTMSSCACDASRTVSATSWLLASSTTTACLTGQTIPTPTITAVSHPNPQYFRSAEWELTFYAGTTCAANQFPFPSTGANALWGTTTYPCQNLQQASSYGTYVSASIAPSATDCIQLFTDPNCQSSQPTVLCGEGTCCGDSWGGLYPFGNADWSPFFVQSWMVVPQGSSPDASWCNS